jgi:hypothetical protein
VNDLLFFVADADMREAIAGFFGRDAVERIVGCHRIDFDPRRDIRVCHEHDPGLYVRANEFLRPFEGAYRHVVLLVDEAWDGSPGATAIGDRLDAHLSSVGWPPPEGLGLVVQPEVDVWLWSDSPHAAKAMGWTSWDMLAAAVRSQGWLDAGQTKPRMPKEAAEWALRQRKVRRSPALYGQIARAVSIRRCEDPALARLLEALRAWFPGESEASRGE